MKKPTFKTTYLFYTAILSLVVIILLLSVYRILSNFEKSQAKYMVEDYLEIMTEAIETQNITALSELGSDDSSTRFSSVEALYARLIQLCEDGELSYELSPKSFDVNNPIYNILCNDLTVAQLQLTLVSETVKLGFLSIPEWELSSFLPAVATLGSSYTLSIPSGFSVTANGIALTADDIISEEDGVCVYYADGFVEEPAFEIKDTFGNSVTTGTPSLLSSDTPSSEIYSVPVTYERFDLALPADFSVSLTQGTISSISTKDNYTVFSIYTAQPVTLAFLNDYVVASDSIGNPLTFREADGRLLPVYSEYTITAADCYRVYADDVLLNQETAERTALAPPQYLDEEVSLATYRIGLAKDATFQVLDALNAPVSFETSENKIEVPLFDCTVTIPINYELQINGKHPDVEPLIKANPDYQYIAEYIEVPVLLEYRFEGLAKAPTFTVKDNQLQSTDYVLNRGDELTITGQKGDDTLPDWLSAQFDPLAIAKKWSLFMTDDLEGNLNGYYNMRDHLIRGSYYDTVAYQWATNIDITFISDHYFRDPAFSKESVTNVVLYGDKWFSCDIYFEKHMTLTRTGKLQDDIFHRRMYFIHLDDTDDGKDNPHWVIADMQEIQ